MDPIELTGGASPPVPTDARDRAVDIAIWALVALVLVFTGFFAWTVWVDRNAERSATPAGRLTLELAAQVRAKPNDANLRVRYAEALVTAGFVDDGIEQLDQALKADEEHTGAMLDLGIIALQREEYRTAEGYFRRVIELTSGREFEQVDQRRELALFYSGEIALTEKRFEDAVGFFKEALRTRKDAADTYFELALAYKGMDEMVLAEEQLRVALDFDPGYAQAHYELGQLLLAAGDEVGAALHLGRAADLAPNSDEAAEAVEKLGPVEKRMADAEKLRVAGELEQAEEQAGIAYSLGPKDPDAALLLARIIEERGDDERALAVYREADKLRPDDVTIGAAIKRLSAAK